MLRLATFNINGRHQAPSPTCSSGSRAAPDIGCLQELKVSSKQFPARELKAAGYGSLVARRGQIWNGVAILGNGHAAERRRASPCRTTKGLACALPRGGGPRRRGRQTSTCRTAIRSGGQVCVQARVVRVADRARADPVRVRRAGRARRRLQRRANRRRHLQPALMAAQRAPPTRARAAIAGCSRKLARCTAREASRRALYTFWDYYRDHWKRTRACASTPPDELSGRTRAPRGGVDSWVRDGPNRERSRARLGSHLTYATAQACNKDALRSAPPGSRSTRRGRRRPSGTRGAAEPRGLTNRAGNRSGWRSGRLWSVCHR